MQTKEDWTVLILATAAALIVIAFVLSNHINKLEKRVDVLESVCK